MHAARKAAAEIGRGTCTFPPIGCSLRWVGPKFSREEREGKEKYAKETRSASEDLKEAYQVPRVWVRAVHWAFRGNPRARVYATEVQRAVRTS